MSASDSSSDIVTRCPKCNTAFRVTPNQLAVADGVVRCGSCLAVFKVIDENSTSAQTTPAPEKYQANNAPRNAPSFLPETSAHDNHEALIRDEDEESVLSLEEDIYDLETGGVNKDKKTSLFDRTLKPISQHARESADESWALDMLADLENDDNIKPLIKKQPATIEDTPAPPPTKETNNIEPATLLASEASPALTEAQNSPMLAASQSPAEEAPGEALYFDHDQTPQTTPSDAQEKPLESEPPQTKDHKADGKREDIISDENIESAIQSRTSYASDYIANIEPAPVEMEWYEPHRSQRWLWLAGALLAGLALLVQTSIFRFESLSKNPTYRPYYQSACRILGCQLPMLIDTSKIRATNLHMRKHPRQAKALIVDAIIINTAPYQQPYPELRLEFSDLNNQLVAARNLQPSDYLRGELAGAIEMPSNQPIQLSLGIVHPGEAATGYQLTVIKSLQEQ